MKYSFLLSLYIKEDPQHLEKCLQSLSNQTIMPDETIVVFDGFISNNLEKIVDKWTELLKIKKIKIEKNVGLGLALNEGLKQCNNEIVARVDTDDIYRNDRAELQLNYIKNNPSCIIIGSNIIEFKENINDLGRKRLVPENKKDIAEFSKKRNPFNHMSVMYKKSEILSLGGYKHHLYMEDYNLWIRAISKNYNIHNMQENLVFVRVGTNSEMTKRRRGLTYVKSEFVLYRLIISEKINTGFSAFFIFIMRSTTRLLPLFILNIIYKKQRNNK